MTPVIGPLFWYEWLRISRRGSHLSQRVGLALVLLVVLFFLYSSWFPSFQLHQPFQTIGSISLNDSARFAGAFAFTVMAVQFVAMVVLTPVFVAGGLVEDIRRGTVEQLLVTALTDREIVVGQFFARLTQLGCIMLTGLPVLALTMLFGGVSISVLLQSYAVLFASMLMLAAMTLAIAVDRDDLRPTLFLVYTYALFPSLIGCCCATWNGLGGTVLPISPPMFLFQLFYSDPARLTWQTPALMAFALVFSAMCISGAVEKLRPSVLGIRNRTVDSVEHFSEQASRTPKFTPVDGSLELIGRETAPPGLPSGATFRVGFSERIDDDHPLLWKERNTRGRLRLGAAEHELIGCAIGIGSLMLTAFLLLMVGSWLRTQRSDLINDLVRVLGLFVLGYGILSRGLNAAGSVARERDRDTLITLWTLPVERHEILAAKWQAAWGRDTWIHTALLLLLGFGIFTGGLNLLYAPLALGYGLSLFLFTVSLGMWFSTIRRTGLAASVQFLAVWLMVLFLPYLFRDMTPGLYRLLVSEGTLAPQVAEFCEALSPIEAWNNLNLSRGNGNLPDWASAIRLPVRILGAVVSCMLCLGLSYLLWLHACYRFEREGKS